VQLSAAAHQVDASLFASTALGTPPATYAFPALTSNSHGFAIQGGLILNTDYFARRQVLAAYEKGAYSYIAGDNLGCSGACEQQWGFDIAGAYKDYWLPILSSAVYGSYLELHYPAGALAGFGGAVGVSNLLETRVGTNLRLDPARGLRYRRRVHVCAPQSDAAGWGARAGTRIQRDAWECPIFA
jgi:hypothetical protein